MSSETDYAVLRKTLDILEADPIPGGWAAEFGVYTGYSLGIIAQRLPVVGFDSFQGLPEDWREGFPKGKFNMKGKPSLGTSLFPPSRAMIVPGLFEDTVPNFQLPLLALVHIDCDLYSSTVTALDGVLASLCPGTCIVFDEYQGYPGSEEHEEQAFTEFIERHSIEVEVIAESTEERAFRIKYVGSYDD